MFAGWAVLATARSAGRVDVRASPMSLHKKSLVFDLPATLSRSDFPYTKMSARPRVDFIYTLQILQNGLLYLQNGLDKVAMEFFMIGVDTRAEHCIALFESLRVDSKRFCFETCA